MAQQEATTNAAPALDPSVSDATVESVFQTNFSVIEQDALTLMKAASMLIDATTPDAVSVALDNNLKLWVAIKTVVQAEENALPPQIKQNLASLAQYVSTVTMEATQGEIEYRRLVGLARINMQIAEGLLGGQTRRMVEQRAYDLWDADGKPEGRSLDHWLQAEQEVLASLRQP